MYVRIHRGNTVDSTYVHKEILIELLKLGSTSIFLVSF